MLEHHKLQTRNTNPMPLGKDPRKPFNYFVELRVLRGAEVFIEWRWQGRTHGSKDICVDLQARMQLGGWRA